MFVNCRISSIIGIRLNAIWQKHSKDLHNYGSGIPTPWKATPQTSRQRHDSGAFNRSNSAPTAWNHRYVSLLSITHDRTWLKQRYRAYRCHGKYLSEVVEDGLWSILSASPKVNSPRRSPCGENTPRLWTAVSRIIPYSSPGTWHGDSSQTTQVWLTHPPCHHSWTLNECRLQYIPAGVSVCDWHLSLSL